MYPKIDPSTYSLSTVRASNDVHHASRIINIVFPKILIECANVFLWHETRDNLS